MFNSSNISIVIVVCMILGGISFGGYLLYKSFQKNLTQPAKQPTIESYQIPSDQK